MHIETLSIDQLVPYALNSRIHSEKQVAQIAASIQEFGFTNPVLIDAQGGIIAGHGRVMAARKLGIVDVPCIRLGHLTETQKRAYIIADNKLALNAGWDENMLALELRELADLDFDLGMIGFSNDEINSIFDDQQEPELKEVQYSSSFSVIVECEDEKQQEKVFNHLNSEGYICRVQSL